MAEMAEKSTVILVNTIRESRRKRQKKKKKKKNVAAWRRKVLNVFFLLLLISSQRNVTPVSRSRRRLTRNIGWWENTWNNYSEARFKKTFRVSRSTFRYILNRIAHFLLEKL